jgi:hypothetical protein
MITLSVITFSNIHCIIFMIDCIVFSKNGLFYLWWLAQFSVQNGQHSNFQCRLILDESGSVADCVIDSKNRKSCKKCRFNKCLLAGMKATWVCSESKGNVSFWGNLGLKYYYRVWKNVVLTNVYWPVSKVTFSCMIIFGNLGKTIKSCKNVD